MHQVPEDYAALKALAMEQAEALADARRHLAIAQTGLVSATLMIEKLKIELARLRRETYGASSERLGRIEQLELQLEDLEETFAAATPVQSEAPLRKPVRRPLPDHLPRHEVVHEPALGEDGCSCPACGGRIARLGEDATEELEYVPASFRVIRHLRPKYACRACETVHQAPMPSRPIERGRPGPGLLAQVLVAKYDDHLPLYRQSEIYAREGVDLERSTLADWVGRSAALLQPLADAIGEHVMAASKLHADDTPVPVLDPGRGRTKTGRLWVYVRDDRPSGSQDPPAAFYRYSPDRKGERPREHLEPFSGVLQADAYAGFAELYRKNRIVEAACMAHARRKLHEIYEATASPIAEGALTRIAALYEIEDRARGRLPDERRRLRQVEAVPRLNELRSYLDRERARLPAKSKLAGAIRYSLVRWAALTRYADDGRVEIDNNAAERALRSVAVGRKNYLFAGSDAGGDRAAVIYSLIETAKLNAINPHTWLSDVIGRIADHPARQIDQLLPWNWSPR
jgi:transposase